MPKHLISVIGLVVSLSVIALGVMLVAVPLYLQAVSVSAQTVTVADTNDLYQAQVDRLLEEQERQGEIEESVAALRGQIPAVPQLDDAFEVIARAAERAGVSIDAVTAGTPAAFVERTGPGVPGEESVAPPATADGSDTGTDGTGDAGQSGEAPDPDLPTPASTASRQQVEFSIRVIAADMRQVTGFLDALRTGPRLLSNLNSTVTQTEPGKLVLSVSALTFVDAER